MAKLTVTRKKPKLDQYRRLLENAGIEPDTVDLEALIDPSVGYDANKRILEEELGVTLAQRDRDIEHKKQREQTDEGNKQAEKRFRDRQKEKAQAKRQQIAKTAPPPNHDIIERVKGLSDEQLRAFLASGATGEVYKLALRTYQERKAKAAEAANAAALAKLDKVSQG